MKLLQIVTSLDPRSGGVAEGVLQQSDELGRQGFAVDIATLDPPASPWTGRAAQRVIELGLPDSWGRLLPARLRRYGLSPRFVPWLKAHLRDYDAAIVNGLWDYTAQGSLSALRRGETPYFVYPHGMLDPWFKKTYPLKHMAKQARWRAVEGRLLAGARRVLFTTADERDLARDAFRPYRVEESVVGYGIADLDAAAGRQVAAFRAAFPALGERPFLLFLSRIHPKKGCDLLIAAYARLAEQSRGFDIVMAGPDEVGWRADLEDLARQHGVSERIPWLGMLGGDIKLGALRACEAFVLPSHQENFGIAVVEALACAKPVMITDKVNIHREVSGSGAGLVACDDQAGIDSLLSRFIALSDRERRAMGEAARRCYLDNFEIGQVTSRVAALLHSLDRDAQARR